MKFQLIVLLSFAQLTGPVVAASDQIKINSEIHKVTVFLSGAEVHRKGTHLIEAGVSELLFENLSPYVDPSSIQVNTSRGVVILSVIHQMNTITDRKKPERIKQLEDSISSYQMKLDFKMNLAQVYQDEKTMILANKNVNGQTGFDIEDLDDLAEYYRDRLSDIMLKNLELQRSQKKFREDIAKMKREQTVLYSKWRKTTSEVIVKVSNKVRTNAKIKVNYMIRNAGWQPTYDIRAETGDKPIELDYKANVYQSSGVDWKDVELTLSTGDPSKNGIKPTPQPWYLNFQTTYNGKRDKKKRYGNYMPRTAAVMDITGSFDEVSEGKADDNFATFVDVSEGLINSEFKIKIPYSIPSDGKKHVATINNYELNADYKYFVAPRQDLSAYLMAQVTGWDTLTLLNGNANVFFEGTFIGKSYLNTASTNDTLEISLGNDKGVVVTRTKVKQFSSTKIIGSNKKEIVAYDITVRNKKSNPITVKVVDQIPVSQQKDIVVELIESGGAKHNAIKGFLKWELELNQSEFKKLSFKYQLKYPKNRQLTNR